MDRLIKIENITDIPAEYRETPIGLLLEYHNLGRPFETYAQEQLLVGMCKVARAVSQDYRGADALPCRG